MGHKSGSGLHGIHGPPKGGPYVPTAIAGLILCTIAGCGQAPPQPPPRAAAVAQQVTFNKDIAPIVYENCAVCHRPVEPRSAGRTGAGQPLDPVCVAGAPFSLLTYEDVRAHAPEIT